MDEEKENGIGEENEETEKELDNDQPIESDQLVDEKTSFSKGFFMAVGAWAASVFIAWIILGTYGIEFSNTKNYIIGSIYGLLIDELILTGLVWIPVFIAAGLQTEKGNVRAAKWLIVASAATTFILVGACNGSMHM